MVASAQYISTMRRLTQGGERKVNIKQKPLNCKKLIDFKKTLYILVSVFSKKTKKITKKVEKNPTFSVLHKKEALILLKMPKRTQ